MRSVRSGALVVALGIAACSPGTETERRTALEHGRDLFSSTEASGGPTNKFTCATCHLAEPNPADTRLLSGYVLAGATARPTFWGGQYSDLLRAINDCRYFFMNAPAAWTADDAQAKAMYAYLDSLPRAQPGALPFSVVKIAEDLPPGDAARGQVVFDGSCRSCHGEMHSGRGRLRDNIPALPEESADSFRRLYNFSAKDIRLTFIEKVRHGPFLGVYGSMPLYSKEAMSDADLAAVVTALGLY